MLRHTHRQDLSPQRNYVLATRCGVFDPGLQGRDLPLCLQQEEAYQSTLCTAKRIGAGDCLHHRLLHLS